MMQMETEEVMLTPMEGGKEQGPDAVPKTTNLVILTGARVLTEPEYSHEAYGIKFYRMTVAVPRLSGTENILPVILNEDLIDPNENLLGKTVTINGNYRSQIIPDEPHGHLMLTVYARHLAVEEEVSEIGNSVFLTAYIVKQPYLRKTPKGRTITDVMVAVHRPHHVSDYIPCIFWGLNAESVAKLPVGTKIQINGRIQSRIYQKVTESGEMLERTAYEVSVNSYMTLED